MGGSESVQENLGWRILEVLPNSPASNKSIVPYFEFIVGVNGVRLNASSEMFWNLISKNVDRQVTLTLFNYKTRLKRDIIIIPSSDWGGQGLLGMVVVLFDFTKADESCIRVIRVHDNSPASVAGLEKDDDYIMGTPVEPFTDIAKFTQVLDDFMEQPLPIWVYNSSRADIRLTEIIASHEWGGDGVLGCEVGGGFLHNIPSLEDDQTEITVTIPDILTEDDFVDKPLSDDDTSAAAATGVVVTTPEEAHMHMYESSIVESNVAQVDTRLSGEAMDEELRMPEPDMIEDRPVGISMDHMHTQGNHVGNNIDYREMPHMHAQSGENEIQQYMPPTRNTSLLDT